MLTSKYHYERISFVKKHGEQPILKTTDAIAEYLWFSFRKTYQAVRILDPRARADAFRLLRYAQEARIFQPKEMTDLWSDVGIRQHGRGFFDVAVSRPAAYMHPVQRLEINGAFVGITTRAERIPGGKIRIHYSSKLEALKLKKIEIRDRACDYLKSQDLHIWQAVFHCEKTID